MACTPSNPQGTQQIMCTSTTCSDHTMQQSKHSCTLCWLTLAEHRATEHPARSHTPSAAVAGAWRWLIALYAFARAASSVLGPRWCRSQIHLYRSRCTCGLAACVAVLTQVAHFRPVAELAAGNLLMEHAPPSTASGQHHKQAHGLSIAAAVQQRSVLLSA